MWRIKITTLYFIGIGDVFCVWIHETTWLCDNIASYPGQSAYVCLISSFIHVREIDNFALNIFKLVAYKLYLPGIKRVVFKNF